MGSIEEEDLASSVDFDFYDLGDPKSDKNVTFKKVYSKPPPGRLQQNNSRAVSSAKVCYENSTLNNGMNYKNMDQQQIQSESNGSGLIRNPPVSFRNEKEDDERRDCLKKDENPIEEDDDEFEDGFDFEVNNDSQICRSFEEDVEEIDGQSGLDVSISDDTETEEEREDDGGGHGIYMKNNNDGLLIDDELTDDEDEDVLKKSSLGQKDGSPIDSRKNLGLKKRRSPLKSDLNNPNGIVRVPNIRNSHHHNHNKFGSCSSESSTSSSSSTSSENDSDDESDLSSLDDDDGVDDEEECCCSGDGLKSTDDDFFDDVVDTTNNTRKSLSKNGPTPPRRIIQQQKQKNNGLSFPGERYSSKKRDSSSSKNPVSSSTTTSSKNNSDLNSNSIEEGEECSSASEMTDVSPLTSPLASSAENSPTMTRKCKQPSLSLNPDEKTTISINNSSTKDPNLTTAPNRKNGFSFNNKKTNEMDMNLILKAVEEISKEDDVDKWGKVRRCSSKTPSTTSSSPIIRKRNNNNHHNNPHLHHHHHHHHHQHHHHRTNLSYSNERARQIEKENERLLNQLLKLSSSSPSPKSFSSTTTNKFVVGGGNNKKLPLKSKVSHSAINRQRELRRIDKENEAFLRRLQSARASHGLSRDEQLEEYNSKHLKCPRTKSASSTTRNNNHQGSPLKRPFTASSSSGRNSIISLATTADSNNSSIGLSKRNIYHHQSSPTVNRPEWVSKW